MLNSSHLYKSEWLALVFKNRNQNYGAYVLRQQSDGIVAKSLLLAGTTFVLLFVGPMIFKKKIADLPKDRDRVVEIQDIEPIHEMKPPVEEKKAAAPAAQAPKQTVKSVNFTDNIKVVEQPITDDPPKLADVQQAVISNTTQSGIEGTNALPLVSGKGNGSGGDGDGNGADEKIYIGVEAYPEFPGGMAALSKFIQKNLRYPTMAQENGTQGKVFLSFVVEKDGSITDATVVKGIGSGCDEEALRVIKKSPRWKPGFQNNKPVRVRYNIPINYTMQL